MVLLPKTYSALPCCWVESGCPIYKAPLYFISPPFIHKLPNIVFQAVEEFGREVRERCLLHWERTKTEVFTWEGELPAGTPNGLHDFERVIDRT